MKYNVNQRLRLKKIQALNVEKRPTSKQYFLFNMINLFPPPFPSAKEKIMNTKNL
tara:strand:+ start:496 stop:660 length:165 start_codon:yes stop_codon:yes gene_type:complete